jgi:ribosome maturation protein SDO1
MRVRITMPSKDAKRVGDKVKAECEEVEEEEPGAEWEAVSTASRGYGGLG